MPNPIIKKFQPGGEVNLNSGKKSITGKPPTTYDKAYWQKRATEIAGGTWTTDGKWHFGTSTDSETSQNESKPKEGGKWTEGLNLLSGGLSSLTSGFSSMNDSVNGKTLSIRDSATNLLMQSPDPTMKAIGVATDILNKIGDATGYHVDDMDKDAAERAGVSGGERFLNNAISAIPGMGTLMAVFSPNKTKDLSSLTDFGNSVMGSYSGLDSNINTADTLSGKRTLFGIGRGKINRYIDKTNSQTDIVNQIGRTNTLAKQSDYGTNIGQQNLNRYAGTNYQTHTVGKNGMKIMSRQELQTILAKRKLQNGGVIGTDTNLLPEGALHARLNHLDEINPDLEDATKKGIPVLDQNGNQVAEIEKEELIFRLDLTNKIEELMKDGSEEAMIEAGKLIANEIISNTQDNTGQITEEAEDGK